MVFNVTELGEKSHFIEFVVEPQHPSRSPCNAAGIPR